MTGSAMKSLKPLDFSECMGVYYFSLGAGKPATKWDGIIAQLGEHLPYKQGVTGSSPVGPIYGEMAQLARASGSYPGG